MSFRRFAATALMAGTIAALSPSTVLAQDGAKGDPAKGEKLFRRCSACHSLKQGTRMTGPSLYRIVGKKAGTMAKFRYGSGLKKAKEKGLVWTPEALFAYLDYPRNYLRKYLEDKSASSKMVYRMKKKQQRLDVIAYLAKVTAEQAAKEKPAAKKE